MVETLADASTWNKARLEALSDGMRRFGASLLMQPIACVAALATLFVNPRMAFNAFAIIQVAGGILSRRSRRKRP
jgi:uncharacterized membrane protein